MEFSYLSLIGAFAMLAFGVADYAVLKQLLYVPLRDHHERAKLTATKTIEPRTVWTVLKVMNFVILPALGLIFGDPVLRAFLG